MRTDRVAIACIGIALMAQSAAAAPLQLSYDGTLGGLRVIKADATLDLNDAGYAVRVGVRTLGGFAVLVRGRSDVVAQGVWQDGRAVATYLESEGTWNGRPHRLIMDYDAGVPRIRVQVPLHEAGRRSPVTQADIAGSVDALGLFAGLLHAMQTTRQCQGNQAVYDGRGVTRFAMQAGAPVALLPYANAIRCDFTTRKVAGLQQDDDPARIGHGYAVFASAGAGLPVLPVRVVFTGNWAGDAALLLVSAKAGLP